MKPSTESMRAIRARRKALLESHGMTAISAELQIPVADHETIRAYAKFKGVAQGLVLTTVLSDYIQKVAAQWRQELRDAQ